MTSLEGNMVGASKPKTVERNNNGSQDRGRDGVCAVALRAHDVKSRMPERARTDLREPRGSNPLGPPGPELSDAVK